MKEFVDGGRNFKGIEVTLDLEDEESRSTEKSSSKSGEEHASTHEARDTHGELNVLASQIGALGAGRKVNLEEMNKKIAKLVTSSKRVAKSRRKGKLTVKFGEVSGPGPLKKEKDPSSG